MAPRGDAALFSSVSSAAHRLGRSAQAAGCSTFVFYVGLPYLIFGALTA